jgi:Tol biopolymer transport system component
MKPSCGARHSVKIVVVLALVGALGSSTEGNPKFSGWSVPENLGPMVNSSFLDSGPTLSKNGLSLYFTSTRPGGFGAQDIWVAQRPTVDSPWGAPANLGALINTDAIEAVPALSRDEHWLFFNSDRPGGLGSGDIWASWRSHVHDDFGWSLPINLGDGVNSPFNEVGPGFFENDDAGIPMLFFASTRPGGQGLTDIYVSAQVADGMFGPAHLIAGLSSPQLDVRPVPSFDGLELFFGSSRVGTLGGLDLWVATRKTTTEPWPAPVNLAGAVNTAASEQQPFLGSDRRTLFFASDRVGGSGGLDLYVTVRVRRHEE